MNTLIVPQCTETNAVDKGTIGIVPYTTCYLSLKNYYSHPLLLKNGMTRNHLKPPKTNRNQPFPPETGRNETFPH